MASAVHKVFLLVGRETPGGHLGLPESLSGRSSFASCIAYNYGMSKRIPYVFVGFGVLWFLLATGFFMKSSEGALVDGAMGLLPGIAGFFGARTGSQSIGRAVGLGVGYSVLAGLSLVVFFDVIWPML